MFSDDVLERIFANKEMQTIPIGCQSTAVSVIEKILEDMEEETKNDKKLLFSTTEQPVYEQDGFSADISTTYYG